MTKVDPLGGGSPQKQRPVAGSKKNTEIVPANSGSVSIPPAVQVDDSRIVPPLEYPALLVPLRNTLFQLHSFDDFLDELSKKFKGANSEIFQIGLDGDGRFLEYLETEGGRFGRAGIDLVASCLGVLKRNNNFREKSLLSAIVVALDEQAFVSDYLLPSLEKRSSFENIANNKNFSVQILKDLNKEPLLTLFKLINFDEIMSTDNLATSLSELPNQHAVLGALVEVYDESSEYSFMKSESHSQKEKIQKLILEVAKKLKEQKKSIPVEPLQAVYKTTEKSESNDTVAELLSFATEASAHERFLFEVVNDSSDDSYTARRVRFWAIDDIFKCGPQAALKLGDLILRSKDQFLVNYAVHKLVTAEKDSSSAITKQRHDVVINAITRKINLNEPSYALAFVVSMIGKEPTFTELFKQLLSKKYLPARGLEDGLANISDVQTNKIERSSEGGLTFHFDSTEKPVTVIDAFQRIGISTIIEWAIKERENFTLGQKHIEENMLRLFVYAYRDFNREMSSLMLAVMADTRGSGDKTYLYLAGLAGQKNSGDDLM